MLAQQPESLAVVRFLDHSHCSFEQKNARLDTLQIPSWHLKNSLVTIGYDNSGASLNCPYIEVTCLV